MTAGTARRRKTGAGTIEAGFIFLFLMGILFLLLDLCWGVFCKVSLQHAVREGCRYAITSQVQAGYGHLDSIKRVVRSNAMGFLSSDSDFAKIAVNFYRIDDLQQMTGAGSNAGGNLAVVSVENYSLRPLVPLLRSSSPLTFSVRAADKLEASPSGIPPDLNNPPSP
ncbi:MAG: hypothetical protein IPP47_15130 [Bryobacterales bacterium]|nr:hypothetical protein [Bryobacterales bacterium]